MSTTPPTNEPADTGTGGYPTYPGAGADQPAGTAGPGGYPVHPGTPPGGDQPARPGSDVPQPGSIRLAVRLMWAGAALSLVGLIVMLATLDSLKTQLRDQLEKSDPSYTQSDFDALLAVTIGVAVIMSLVGIALWLWMAWKNGQGRSWARIVATVLGALSVLSAIYTIAVGTTTGSLVVTLISTVLAIVIVVLLWRKESSEFYAARSRPQWG